MPARTRTPDPNAHVGHRKDGDGVFAMCQSFPYTPEIEAEMERCVAKLRLARAVEWDRLGEDGGTKLQLFRRQ